jgi:hypothetical protein
MCVVGRWTSKRLLGHVLRCLNLRLDVRLDGLPRVLGIGPRNFFKRRIKAAGNLTVYVFGWKTCFAYKSLVVRHAAASV